MEKLRDANSLIIVISFLGFGLPFLMPIELMRMSYESGIHVSEYGIGQYIMLLITGIPLICLILEITYYHDLWHSQSDNQSK